jgi:eukaryotic-like serine/threonine-protein kinase
VSPIRFGRYFLIKKLAIGGMGEVWLARVAGESNEQPPIVVKRLLDHLKEDQEFVNMFFDEARIAAALDHPNIARIEDLGEAGGSYYIAMEFVHGMSFGDVVNAALEAGTDMPLALKCRVIAEAAAALDFAHRAKTEAGTPLELIHRDVSPHNIMVGFDGSVKLIDFGVARAANKLTRTATGIIKGKYAYMSPEQAWGKELDGRSDLFGLGVVLWEVLALERLFKRENDTATLRAVVGAEVVPPSHKESAVPKGLDAIVLKALTRDLDSRYQTGNEFKKALEAFLTKQRLYATKAHLAGWMQQLFPEKASEQFPSGLVTSSHSERSSPVLKPAIADPKLPRSRVLDSSELEQRIASAGTGALRGLFCNSLLSAVMKLVGPLADQRVRKAAAEPKPYVDQLSYPTTEFLRMLWKAVELVLPKARNVDEAFEFIGASMMDGLLRSPFGKALESQKERFPEAIVKPLVATLNPMIVPGQRMVSGVATGRAILVFKDEVLPIQLYIGMLRSLVHEFYGLPIEARWEKPSAQRIELTIVWGTTE